MKEESMNVLNVCREPHGWNANYSTTISKYVIVYKHPGTSMWESMAIVGIPST